MASTMKLLAAIRRTQDENFMQMVYDETHPGHDRAFQRSRGLPLRIMPERLSTFSDGFPTPTG